MEIKEIGYVFCMDMVKTVQLAEIKTALEKSQLDPEIARSLSKRFCFARAKNQLKALGLIDEVIENENRWIWQLSEKFLKEQGEEVYNTYRKKAIFWYNKTDETIGSDSEVIKEKVEELFAEFGLVYTPSDITKLVKRIFERQRGMIRLIHQGVVYFVPITNKELMDKVSLFLKEIKINPVIVHANTNSQDVIEQVPKMLKVDIEKKLELIVKEISEIQDKKQKTRIAGNRWLELLTQLEQIYNFCESLTIDAKEFMKSIKNTEINMSLINEAGDLSVIAALAQNGLLPNTLTEIAKNAYSGELPPIDNPKIKACKLIIDEQKEVAEVPVIKTKLKIE